MVRIAVSHVKPKSSPNPFGLSLSKGKPVGFAGLRLDRIGIDAGWVKDTHSKPLSYRPPVKLGSSRSLKT